MQIAREAIRLTFKHWPPSERLTRQPYCLSINLHLITHKAPLAGGNLLGNTPQRRGGWGQYGDACLHGLRVPGQLPGCCWRLRPCSPSASLLPEACWGSSPAWRHRGLEHAEQPSPSAKKLAHPQQGGHRAAVAGAVFFFLMEPRCPELRGLLPTVPTCSVCPDGCPHAPRVPASPSCAKPVWSRPQQPPASARPLKMLLSILLHFLTPLPSLSALGRWDKNSVFL